MFSMRSRLAAVTLVLVAGGAVLGQASAAVADDHDRHGGFPVLVVSPAPGKLTKEHKITDTFQYDPKASGSSQEQPPPPGGGSAQPSAPEPGPVSNAKDTANQAVQSAASGAGSTADSALK
ncbi:hypothetical protein AB0F13_22950 [Streptomyces sp. NPDC026206]|uniref:hypothetical protein n=1 Tax=Streptomyces sp. NPDC026206 TaxID=3157089 RepID=UPI0033CCAC46